MPVFLLLPFSVRTAAKVIFLQHRFQPVPPLLEVVATLPEAQSTHSTIYLPAVLSGVPLPLLMTGRSSPTELTLLRLCGFPHPIAFLSLMPLTASPCPFPDLGPNSELSCCVEPYQANSISYCSPGTLLIHLFSKYLQARSAGPELGIQLQQRVSCPRSRPR